MQRNIQWWKDCYEYVIGSVPDDDSEFLDELLGVANECGWEFAYLMEHAITKSLTFPVIVEIEPYQDGKGRSYLIVSACDARTLVSLTANPVTATISVSYIVPEISSIEEIDELLDEICADLANAHAVRVGDK